MTTEEYANEALAALFRQATVRFGAAIKTSWFYDLDTCPGCGGRKIGSIKHKGKDAISLNAFIHRDDGVLIGYLLCGKCGTTIFQASEKNPYVKSSLHTIIENNLILAYRRYVERLEA